MSSQLIRNNVSPECASHWHRHPHLPLRRHPGDNGCSAHFLSYVIDIFLKQSCHQPFSYTHNNKSLCLPSQGQKLLAQLKGSEFFKWVTGFSPVFSPVTTVTSSSEVQGSLTLCPLGSLLPGIFLPRKKSCSQVSVDPLVCKFTTSSVLLAVQFLECMIIHARSFFHNRLYILWVGCSVTNEHPRHSLVLGMHKCPRNREWMNWILSMVADGFIRNCTASNTGFRKHFPNNALDIVFSLNHFSYTK